MRFVHAADFHLGKPFGKFDEDTRVLLRAARFEALHATGEFSVSHDAGFVVIAGDTFDAERLAIALNLPYLGVMADSLLKATTSAKYRKKIMAGDLVLITPFNPEAGFNVGNAMTRNRYIYCLSDAAVVISSTVGKGGTWNGAIEDLSAGWVPLWVKRTENPKSGNSVLVSKGANLLPNDGFSVKTLTEASASDALVPAGLLQRENKEPNPKSETISKALQTNDTETLIQEIEYSAASVIKETPLHHAIDLFGLFILKFRMATSKVPLKVDEIAAALELEKYQANAWLERGITEGTIRKLQRPVRYQAVHQSDKQASLF